MSNKSVFATLSEVEVTNKVRQKGNLWYVSWSNAVRELLKRYPEATWDFTKYDGLPYLKTETGFYVECVVTVGELSRTQMMPVLNHKNQTDMSPDAFLINKAQMRALTKAIALHGFGLDLWAGEDTDPEPVAPEHDEEVIKQNEKERLQALQEQADSSIERMSLCQSMDELKLVFGPIYKATKDDRKVNQKVQQSYEQNKKRLEEAE